MGQASNAGLFCLRDKHRIRSRWDMSKTGRSLEGLRSRSQIVVLFVALIIFIVLLFVNFAYLNTQSNYDKQYIGHAGELRVLSQRIAKNASEAAAGKPQAFKLLADARNDFDMRWGYLRKGDKNTGLPPAPQDVRDELQTVQADWEALRRNSDVILANEQTVLSLHQVAATLAETIPQLQVEYEKVVDILLQNRAPASQVAVAQRQSLLAERILGSVNKVLAGDDTAVQAADAFGRDASQFGQVLSGMLDGNVSLRIAQVDDPAARARLAEIAEWFQFVSGSVDEILETSPELFEVRESAGNIFNTSQTLLDETSVLANRLEHLASARSSNTIGGYVLGLLALMSIILIGLVMVRETNRQLRETAEKSERNQNAIMRLLDEIENLADGDLTVAASVTEDFTGAIADSINYSIDQLRELVATINLTAEQVFGAVKDTQGTATQLAAASEHQALQIAAASNAINRMTGSIDLVSANAHESWSVAERSVAIANKGNEVVHNTINGMDNIREQIQDTSKRIKRLGESSQEIGDIVSLIDDIADQTNILALNAAIQASMAGDAGRGFAVVADEVQRLAERSSSATKQIETLVRAIQNDTNEAVISMEQTTTEVVRGARLAQDAGVALEEIEGVSKILAALIQSITNAAQQQSELGLQISQTMTVIQQTTSQTTSGTAATARSMGNLAKMASAMRRSVSGFTLPSSKDRG
ncbi:Chemotaxis sensory transducer [Pseudomonas savastanoi pv. glycinea]|nr:Chemotaxis sensory transducer [Pseudomonas savastanoi pv. glycinea]